MVERQVHRVRYVAVQSAVADAVPVLGIGVALVNAVVVEVVEERCVHVNCVYVVRVETLAIAGGRFHLHHWLLEADCLSDTQARW